MRLHWLGHVPFEDDANIGVWAEKRNHAVTSTRLYEGESLPDVSEIDALAIMGGPMNVNQHRQHPWLVAEKRFIEKAIGADVAIIGVCLGAQLIADVLGAKVTENPHVEIGWFPVRLTDAGRDCWLLEGFPAEFQAFHWHGDTFAIPAGAIRLAQSEACENQAFLYGKAVLGLQFHLEYSHQSILDMLAEGDDELIDAPFIQSTNEIIAGLENVAPATDLLFSLLDNWIH